MLGHWSGRFRLQAIAVVVLAEIFEALELKSLLIGGREGSLLVRLDLMMVITNGRRVAVMIRSARSGTCGRGRRRQVEELIWRRNSRTEVGILHWVQSVAGMWY